MKTKPIPENIGEYLELNEDSPSGLIWKKKTAVKTIVGSIAGHFHKAKKRWITTFKGQLYYSYRVVYYLRTGIDPKGAYIDHATHKAHTNEDLRLANSTDNLANTRIRCDNTSGFKGVVFDKKRKLPWRARLTFKGAEIHLGRFKTKEEAARAYNDAALEHFGEFAYLNKV